MRRHPIADSSPQERSVGFLTSIINPRLSGLATVVFRDDCIPRATTSYVSCHCESGFGVRQLIGALGIGGRLTNESAGILVEFAIDDLGLLAYIAPIGT